MDIDETAHGLHVSLDGKELTLRPGQVARIGRNPDNDLVAEAPVLKGTRHRES